MKKLLVIGLLLLVLPPVGQAQSSQPMSSQAEVERLLAPVALYPDTVLSHLLIAATQPLDVVQAERWISNRPHLRGDDAVSAAGHQNWGPSVIALVAFPDLLARMSKDLDWTRSLGQAFMANETLVLTSIQSLRERAHAKGHLRTSEHIEVLRESSAIIIAPRRSHLIYLPHYDTRIVYGHWQRSGAPPIYWHYPRGPEKKGLSWGLGVRLKDGIFTSTFRWRQHQTVIIGTGRQYTGRSIARHRHARQWHHFHRNAKREPQRIKAYPELPASSQNRSTRRLDTQKSRRAKSVPEVKQSYPHGIPSSHRQTINRQYRTPRSRQTPRRNRSNSGAITNFGGQSFQHRFDDRIGRHTPSGRASTPPKKRRQKTRKGGKLHNWKQQD